MVYYFTTEYKSQWTVEMRSSDFDPYLELRDASSRLIGRNDNTELGRNSRIHALLPRGLYQLVAFSNSPGIGGAFSVDISTVPPAGQRCDGIFVTKGDSTGGTLLPLMCGDDILANYDLYRLHIVAGENLAVNVRDQSYSGYRVDIMDEKGKVLATSEQGQTYLDYVARYTADSDIDLVIKVSSADSYADYSIAFK